MGKHDRKKSCSPRIERQGDPGGLPAQRSLIRGFAGSTDASPDCSEKRFVLGSHPGRCSQTRWDSHGEASLPESAAVRPANDRRSRFAGGRPAIPRRSGSTPGPAGHRRQRPACGDVAGRATKLSTYARTSGKTTCDLRLRAIAGNQPVGRLLQLTLARRSRQFAQCQATSIPVRAVQRGRSSHAEGRKKQGVIYLVGTEGGW